MELTLNHAQTGLTTLNVLGAEKFFSPEHNI
jgi:hypothetical protein